MGKHAHIVLAILCLGLTFGSCSRNKAMVEDAVAHYGEDAVYRSGDSVLYLCRHEWNNIILGEQNPQDVVAYLPWRVPTKDEGMLLHRFEIEVDHRQRYICYDEESDTYYTFLFGSGNVTKAGMKTKYTLRPVRLVCHTRDTVVNL